MGGMGRKSGTCTYGRESREESLQIQDKEGIVGRVFGEYPNVSGDSRAEHRGRAGRPCAWPTGVGATSELRREWMDALARDTSGRKEASLSRSLSNPGLRICMRWGAQLARDAYHTAPGTCRGGNEPRHSRLPVHHLPLDIIGYPARYPTTPQLPHTNFLHIAHHESPLRRQVYCTQAHPEQRHLKCTDAPLQPRHPATTIANS